MVRSAANLFRGKSRIVSPIEQFTGARDRDRTAPAAPRHERQQLGQALLRAPGIAELIQHEDLHGRTARASTKKYTGSTRQYVSRSPEAICTISPAQKHSIQVP